METEIINLLRNENKLSDSTISEINSIEIDEFFDSVKELGSNETEHIKKDKIQEGLNTKFIGRDIYIFKEVMSTNTLAKFFAENGSKDGTVIISEKQTNAKGRSGKAWESPLGGVWLSIVLNPYVDQTKLPIITLATGLAVEKTFERLGITNAEIKWPNDILINDKKVCGVLIESIAKFNSIEHVIVGVGIDVNLDIESLPEELQDGTTSLNVETGKEIDENTVIRTFLEEFEKVCNTFIKEDYESILKEWRKHAYTIGKNVEIREPFGKTYEGYVVGIDKQGVLVIEKPDGELKKVISGECIIKK